VGLWKFISGLSVFIDVLFFVAEFYEIIYAIEQAQNMNFTSL